MGCFMDCLALKGRSILVVEEDTLLALRLEDELLRAGARALGARRLNEALQLAEHPALAAAVVNLRLGSDSTLQVCRRLAELGIPFVFHTRYDAAEALRTWPDAPVVSKPAESHVVVSSVVRLLH
jgi:ActR/RegA family two-component response regulator